MSWHRYLGNLLASNREDSNLQLVDLNISVSIDKFLSKGLNFLNMSIHMRLECLFLYVQTFVDAPVFCLALYRHCLWYPVSPCWNYDSAAFLCSGFPSPWLFHRLHCLAVGPLFTAGLFRLFFGVYIQSLRRDDSFQRKLVRTKIQTNDCQEHANLSVGPPYLWTPYSRNEPFKSPNLQEKLYVQTFLVIIS